jgi:hypothetical protein
LGYFRLVILEIAKNIKETNEKLMKDRQELEIERKKFQSLKEELDNSRNEFEKQVRKERTFNKESPLVSPHEGRRELQGTGHFKTSPINKKPVGNTFAEQVKEEKEFSDDASLERSPEKRIEEDPSPVEDVSPLADVSPINNESSISGRKVSNNNLLDFGENEEIEVPLDFGESKKSPKDTTDIDRPDFIEDDDELTKKVNEDNELYNPSYYLANEIFEFDKYIDEYVAYKVMKAENSSIGLVICGWETKKFNGEFAIRLFSFREKDGSPDKVEEYTIPFNSLIGALHVINCKDVMPYDKPNKLLRDFRDFMKQFVYPFLMYKKEKNSPRQVEAMQLKASTKGVLSREVHVKFFRKEWSISLQPIGNLKLRLVFYIKMNEAEFSHGYIADIVFDKRIFDMYFKEIEIDPIWEKFPSLDKDKFISSYELTDETFIQDLKVPVKELEAYGKKFYPTSLNAYLYGEEPTHLITQLRICTDQTTLDTEEMKEPSDKKELWIVRDDPKNRKWVFYWKTLYEVKITQRRKEQVERTLEILYDDLWKYFGVDFKSWDKNDVKMFLWLLLDSMKLEMPTMGMKKTIHEDPDAEEEVHIKLVHIDTVCHARHIINHHSKKFMLTISLIANDKTYLGIKAWSFNRKSLREYGVFLRVDAQEWKLSPEEISKLLWTNYRSKTKS